MSLSLCIENSGKEQIKKVLKTQEVVSRFTSEEIHMKYVVINTKVSDIEEIIVEMDAQLDGYGLL